MSKMGFHHGPIYTLNASKAMWSKVDTRNTLPFTPVSITHLQGVQPITLLQSYQLSRFRRVTHTFACLRTDATHSISHAKKKSDFGPRRVRSFSNSPTVNAAMERICNPIRCIDILFTPKSRSNSERQQNSYKATQLREKLATRIHSWRKSSSPIWAKTRYVNDMLFN